jgi:hypothetical protein
MVKQSNDLTSLKLNGSITKVRIRKGLWYAIYYSVNEATIGVCGEITLRRRVNKVVYRTV